LVCAAIGIWVYLDPTWAAIQMPLAFAVIYYEYGRTANPIIPTGVPGLYGHNTHAKVSKNEKIQSV